MPSLFRPLLLAFGLLLGLGCAPAQQDDAAPGTDTAQGGTGGEVVATLDGDEIDEAELEAWIRDQLYEDAIRGKGEHELHAFRSENLRRMAAMRLIEAEADRRGVEPQALYGEVVSGVEPGDEEVRSFYEANRARLPEEATFEQLAPRIRQHLAQQGEQEAWSAFVRGLQDDADLEILLETPRADVAAVGPSKGPEDAPVTIVEFSDFDCPFCKRVQGTLAAVLERYPDQVRLVYRHLPLESIHPRARPTAEAAVCAEEQDAFWDFHDLAFASEEPMSDEALRATAEALELDRACLADGRAAEIVQRDLQAARALGVDSTPAFFVNGIRLSGAQQPDAFARLIEQELARDDEAREAGGTSTPEESTASS